MRMWMVDPKLMCRQHLLGEHGEIHKHRWTFEAKHKKDRYIKNNCIEPEAMEVRHDVLAAEMKRRGYNHKSPYTQPDISYLPKTQKSYRIDREKSTKLLFNKCEKCEEIRCQTMSNT